jgi:hypothetical protein
VVLLLNLLIAVLRDWRPRAVPAAA